MALTKQGESIRRLADKHGIKIKVGSFTRAQHDGGAWSGARRHTCDPPERYLLLPECGETSAFCPFQTAKTRRQKIRPNVVQVNYNPGIICCGALQASSDRSELDIPAMYALKKKTTQLKTKGEPILQVTALVYCRMGVFQISE